MATVIALDPGATVGWAHYDVAADEYDTGQVDRNDLWNFLEVLCLDPLAFVVYEQFEYRDFQEHANLAAAEVIGVIKEWRRQYQPLAALVPQTAQQAKFYFTDSRLREMNLWAPGQRHGMDALKHLLYFRRDFKPEKLSGAERPTAREGN